jgi:hypothetical protein
MSLARAAIALAVLLTMLGSAACGRKAIPEPRKSGSFVAPFINTAAFERRCIRSSCVALLAPYFTVRLSRAPCRRGASTLSVLRRIYEKDHLSTATLIGAR